MCRIREGTGEDLARVRAIQSATLAEPWPALLEAAKTGMPALYVLETAAAGAERVVGYALVIGNGGGGDDPGVAYVPEFAVAPDRQGEGLGSAFMEGLVDRLIEDGMGSIRLTVHADDRRARGFYEKRGFEVLQRVPGHYEDGDGLILSRALEECPGDGTS